MTTARTRNEPVARRVPQTCVEPVNQMRLELVNSVRAPSIARRALGTWLAAVHCPEYVVADALLLVSELVTNAVVHARSASIVLAVFDDDRLRIEVHDCDPRAPVTTESAPVGRADLLLVDSLCDLWGWEPTRYGKRVWTETLC